MSEHVSEEVLAPGDRLHMVLEHMKYLSEQFTQLDSPDDAPETLKSSLDAAVEEVSDIMLGRDISVSGIMTIPATDEYGHVIGTAQANGTLHDCTLTGISVLGETISEQFPVGTVVLQFAYGSTKFDTYTEETEITYKAIFPVSSCSINMVDELENLLNDIVPDPDDPIAEEIDLALLNGSIDISQLAQIILRNFPNLTELQQEMYMRYLQKVDSLHDKSTILLTRGLTLYEVHTGEIEELEFAQPQEVSGEFKGYGVTAVEDDQGETQYLLTVLVYDESLGGVASVYVQDLEEFLFVS